MCDENAKRVTKTPRTNIQIYNILGGNKMKKLATMLKIAAVMAVALFLGGGGVTTELTG